MKALITDAIRYWEPRRLIYNGVLAVIVMVHAWPALLVLLTGDWLPAIAALGLLFTALVPSIDHMNIPFFLVIMPLGFASSTYFPLEGDSPWTRAWLLLNPLHHLAEGIRRLLLAGEPNHHVLAAGGLCALMILVLVPVDERLLRRRVLGEG